MADKLSMAILERYGASLPEHARTALTYYLSCKRGLEMAAEHVVVLAKTVGVEVPRG